MRFNQKISAGIILISLVTLIALYSSTFVVAASPQSNRPVDNFQNMQFTSDANNTSEVNLTSDQNNANNSKNNLEWRNSNERKLDSSQQVASNDNTTVEDTNSNLTSYLPENIEINNTSEAIDSNQTSINLSIKVKPHFKQPGENNPPAPNSPDVNFGVENHNSFYNLRNGWKAIDANTGRLLNQGVDKFKTRKKISLKHLETKVVDVWLGLDNGNSDLNNLQIETVNTDVEKKAAIDWRLVTLANNILRENHTLYVDASWQNGAYVCPTAFTTSEVTSNCASAVSFTHSDCLSGTTFNGITCTITIDNQYALSGLSGTGISASGNSRLVINDSAEGSFVNTNTAATFYAHYQDSDFLHIAGATCQIQFDDNPGVWNAMTEVAGNSRYVYTKAGGFAAAGSHTWEVNCQKATYTTQDVTDTIQVNSQAGSVPFFEDLTLLLALILAGLGATKITKTNEEN